MCALTGINHTLFTSDDLPVFFVVTDFISKGEGGQIKQTPSSSPCLHLVLDNSNASEMSQHLLSEISFIFEVEDSTERDGGGGNSAARLKAGGCRRIGNVKAALRQMDL